MTEEPTSAGQHENACPIEVTPEQLLYARVLRFGMMAGLITFAITYSQTSHRGKVL